ncbi:hypothetical protein QVD17_17212 [Tagetes erecta]|uniref:GTD-binding domain-containing protein n=1 Tax=Tagetes erecta TaxID=13708 RepID=A0AAD8KTG7_TARER|nr:hypothetical protein QVD17_17212 [Tagetes erecta]
MAAAAAANEFMHHLSVACCEWFLMFLMYLDAALGFILTKFAHQCELQTPCLFCFRFDRVFGDGPDYYFSHFCNDHRTEVACLVSCNLHRKLCDVREMCDDCFMSTMKKDQGYPKPLLNKNLVRAPSSTGLCSCCKRQWKPKPRSQIRLGVPKVLRQPPLLPLMTGCYRRRKNFKKARDKISGTTTPCHVGTKIHVDVDMDALSDSGCADLKFSSCSGSESGDSFYEIECENEGLEDDYISRVMIHQAKRSNIVCNLEPSLRNGIHKESITSPLSFTSDGSIGQDLKENGPLDVCNETSPLNQDLHSVSDHNESMLSPLSATSNGSMGHALKENGPLEVFNETSSYNQDLHSINDHNESMLSPLSATSNGSIEHDVKENGPLEVSNETSSFNKDLHSNNDHNESMLSPLSATSNDSVEHDVKENGPLEVTNVTSPFNQDLHSIDDHELSSSLDKHECYESPSTHNVGEIKGESDIEKLKRQMEHDQEQLRLLHKELDEERNAAAIAADEAMAMITRLQEEKSALHMEALQYLRMMDEQAEYDMEALDKANDLVTEKDKEIQDLEAELEFFRSRYDDESAMGNAMGNGKMDSVSSSGSKSMNTLESKAPVLDLEDEKKHILNSISELEMKCHQFSNGDNGSTQQNETDKGTLENEISVLNEWLEAIESDRDFLENACLIEDAKPLIKVTFFNKVEGWTYLLGSLGAYKP